MYVAATHAYRNVLVISTDCLPIFFHQEGKERVFELTLNLETNFKSTFERCFHYGMFNLKVKHFKVNCI
jgi:hypothetical protein